MHRRSPDAIRAEVRAAALTQFLESGYEASTLDDIARRLGMTRQGVLYHYPSKEVLLQSLLTPAFGTLECALDSLPAEPAATPDDRRHILEVVVRAMCEHRDAIALMTRFANNTKTLNIGAETRGLNLRLARLLGGPTLEQDRLMRIRVVTCLAALGGVMGARLKVPLETDDDRATLVDSLVAIFDGRNGSRTSQVLKRRQHSPELH
jgi:AcrR family transcriptional regulator